MLALSVVTLSAQAQTVAVLQRDKNSKSIEPGIQVTYTDAVGRPWCATVVLLGDGPGHESWAWVQLDADPRRIAHGPLGDFKRGCMP